MRLKFLTIVRLTSAFDFIFFRTYDAFHSKWRDLNRILHDFFFQYIDKERIARISENVSKISIFVFMISYSIVRILRLILIVFKNKSCVNFYFFILRNENKSTWFRFRFLSIVARRFNDDKFVSKIQINTWIYVVVVRCNIIVEIQKYIDFDNIHKCVLQNRKCYQNLVLCAQNAKNKINENVNEKTSTKKT